MNNFINKDTKLQASILKQNNKESLDEIKGQLLRNTAEDSASNSNFTVSKVHNTEVGNTSSQVDSSLMQAPEKTSQLTSNVDSVMSYLYPGGQEEMEEKRQENKPEQYKVDLRLLNAEINASVHSEESIQRLQQKVNEQKRIDKRKFVGDAKQTLLPADNSTLNEMDMDIDQNFAQFDNANRHISLNRDVNRLTGFQQPSDRIQTFMQEREEDGQPIQRKKPVIHNKDLMTAIDQKYADEASMMSSTMAAGDSQSMSSTYYRSSNREPSQNTISYDTDKRPQVSRFVVSGSKGSQKVQREVRAQVLDSGISKKKTQRRSLGQDVRYQMKELVAATTIDTEDFFAGNFDADPADITVKKSNTAFLEAATAQEHKKQQLNQRLETTGDDDFRPFFPAFRCPIYEIKDVFPLAPNQRRLTKKGGLMAQFREYLSEHNDGNIPVEDMGNQSDNVTARVLAIQRSNGISCLICEKIDADASLNTGHLNGDDLTTPIKESIRISDNRSSNSKAPELEMLEKMSAENSNSKAPELVMLDKMSTENSKDADVEFLRSSEARSETSKPSDLETLQKMRSESGTKQPGARQLFKVVLNPILTQLQVQTEDVVQIIGVSVSVNVNLKEESSDASVLSQQLVDQNAIQKIIVPLMIVNVSLKIEQAETTTASRVGETPSRMESVHGEADQDTDAPAEPMEVDD